VTGKKHGWKKFVLIKNFQLEKDKGSGRRLGRGNRRKKNPKTVFLETGRIKQELIFG